MVVQTPPPPSLSYTHTPGGQIARLRVEAVSAAEELQRSTRERDDLLDKLQASSAAVARGEDGETGDAGGRWGEEEKKEALRRRRVPPWSWFVAGWRRLSNHLGIASFICQERRVYFAPEL